MHVLRNCNARAGALGSSATLEVPELDGGYRLFAWIEAGPAVGARGNTARWPGVHSLADEVADGA